MTTSAPLRFSPLLFIAALALSACERVTDPARPSTASAATRELLPPPPPPGYELIEVSDDVPSAAFGINGHGVIVGRRTVAPGTTHGFIRGPGGLLVDIPAIAGYPLNEATAVNDANVVVGTSYTAAGLPIAWVKLPTQAATPVNQGPCIVSRANAVNGKGDIVGMCNSRPALWRGFGSSAPELLLSLNPSNPDGEIFDVNDAGVMVGESSSPGFPSRVATKWVAPGVPVAIGLPSGIGNSTARSINVSQDVAGFFSNGIASKGFVAHLGAPTTILPQNAWEISDRGRIVGVVASVNGAYTISPGATIRYMLPPASGTILGWDVNPCGTIVGSHDDGSGERAVMWKKSSCDP